ncbi:MAG: hypothetical protein J6T56_01560, partial [Bacteroidales bacterium]|nr:hypothetical protein [Bacteroidales bacterium]
LRTCWGCSLEQIVKRWGEGRKAHIMRQLGSCPKHYYRLVDNQLVLTEAGLLFADGIAADLFV